MSWHKLKGEVSIPHLHFCVNTIRDRDPELAGTVLDVVHSMYLNPADGNFWSSSREAWSSGSVTTLWASIHMYKTRGLGFTELWCLFCALTFCASLFRWDRIRVQWKWGRRGGEWLRRAQVGEQKLSLLIFTFQILLVWNPLPVDL